jgi:hydrogenase expression/formation protein HypC
MCLAVPGKIIQVDGDTAKVDYEGVVRDVNMALIEAGIGDYIIANAGFAIRKLDKKDAKKSIELFKKTVEKQ